MFAITPFRGQSLLDDLLRDDDDWFTSLMHPMHHHPLNHRHRQLQQSNRKMEPWKEVIRLPGFTKEQVKIDVSEDKSKVKVLAERVDGEEEFKIRRCIQVPESVDKERLQCEFIQQGVLLIHAPYKEQVQLHQRNDMELFPFTSWGALTQDMEQFKSGIEKLLHESQPGTGDLASEMVHDDQTGENRVRLHFDLQGFAPEEIRLEQKGEHGLEVEAKHEGKQRSRYFKRYLELPKNVNVSAMKSQLQSNGVLTLEAPCQLALDDKTHPKTLRQPTELQIQRGK